MPPKQKAPARIPAQDGGCQAGRQHRSEREGGWGCVPGLSPIPVLYFSCISIPIPLPNLIPIPVLTPIPIPVSVRIRIPAPKALKRTQVPPSGGSFGGSTWYPSICRGNPSPLRPCPSEHSFEVFHP